MEMEKITLGRPFGGVALLLHRKFERSANKVYATTDIYGLIQTWEILVVSVYMSVDYGDI